MERWRHPLSGEKKPGLRDISNLKARLSMLNTGKGPATAPRPAAPAVSNPARSAFSPCPEEEDFATDPELSLGADTAVVRLDGPTGKPEPYRPAPRSRPPLAHPIPAAKPPQGGGFSLGAAEELFARPEPTPQAAPVSVQAQAGGFQEPQPNDQFASPFQVGEYTQAAEPVDLNADEQAALDRFERKQVGIRPFLAISMTGAVAALTLVVGFAIGNVRETRRMVNFQIEDSELVRDRMKPLLNKMREVAPVIQSLMISPEAGVDWKKMNYLPEMPEVDASVLLSTRVPLAPDLARMLNNSVVEINQLFVMINQHRRLTLKIDKVELEALEKGNVWFDRDNFAVEFTPVVLKPKESLLKYVPPKGNIVAIIAKWRLNADGTQNEIPVIRRGEQNARYIPLRHLVPIPKSDLVTAGKGNVQTLYRRRIKEMNIILKKIMGYTPSLQDALDREAARSRVFSF